MDAPLYRPSTAYHPPREAPVAFSIDNYSLKELLAYPAAREVVLREISGLRFALDAPQLQSHLGNFTLRSCAKFGMTQMSEVDRVGLLLAALPAGQRPGL